MEEKKPKKAITIFLIASTMLLSLSLFGCGLYSLYISIGFRFLTNSALINTNPLLTYSSSVYTNGSGTLVGLILISIVMLALGVGMVVIFFKQLPLYKQIKLIRKMPNIKYKDYSKEAKKSVIILSIVAYIVCIGFAVFAIITAVSSGVARNYLWAIVGLYAIVLVLSISSMVLMIAKVVQLSKIKSNIINKEINGEEHQKNLQSNATIHHEQIGESQASEQVEIVSLSEPNIVPEQLQVVGGRTDNFENSVQRTDKLFSDGIFELGEQLQKLREMHINGLIDAEEYTLLREKWINAVLVAPLFGKKQRKHAAIKQKQIIAQTDT